MADEIFSKTQSDKINFGELSGDVAFKERILQFSGSLEKITEMTDIVLKHDVYDKLEPADKVRYDLFLAFTINSLYWLYMRTQGKDPSQSDLKNELKRVQEYMVKSKRLYEKKHVMPRLDKGAAGRFVRSGLFDPNDLKRHSTSAEPTAAEGSRSSDTSKAEATEQTDTNETSPPDDEYNAGVAMAAKRKRVHSEGDD